MIKSIFQATVILLCTKNSLEKTDFEKHRFPVDFSFGVASSAYQIEGGYNEDGKGESIFDHYTKTKPKKFFNETNGNVACDSYHKWRTDVKLLADLGVDFYRFSISWSRILPQGFSHPINGDGLRYYNDLINELIANGIKPMVTMHHKDMPMVLQRLGGWTNPYTAYYFEDYARILFSYFGDRVKNWITLEADCSGYGDDVDPPFIDEPSTSRYLCTHVMLLAHAKVYLLYDEEFRTSQNGKIGIGVNASWYEAGSFAPEDIIAAERAREFKIGSIMNPIFHTDGNYPRIMRERVYNVSREEGYLQSRLPILSPQEIDYIQGTYDFAGLNIDTTFLVRQNTEKTNETATKKDLNVTFYQDKSWTKTNTDWLRVVPDGVRKVLKWVKDKYDDPEIFIIGNGFTDKAEINDAKRVQNLQKYLQAILESIHEDGTNVKGYAIWSFLDSFQWTSGYRWECVWKMSCIFFLLFPDLSREKYGLYHVDFSDANRKRTARKSAIWYKKVIKEKRVVDLKEV
ncbi:unnamed protein product [Phyllotreta striolata]|uniref:Glycoside hydrolase family 1 n=1 Tax=Phyllotreta striolata TaxID=444603 RepID=A0A9P0GRP9_PHYSR|nr:unnamed protein product [Phyllotreta striolata]